MFRSFDPATATMMGQVFDQAWGGLPDRTKISGSENLARETLAQIIIKLAGEGERDPERLRQRAVAVFRM